MGWVFEYRRAVKEKWWDKMSKVFFKFVKVIILAVKEGGSELDMNVKLWIVILNVKA